MEMKDGTLWVMPLGAEPLGSDGKQLFYGAEDGLGSVVGVEFTSATFDCAYDED